MKKLLKQQIAASPLAESWNSVPLPLLFDWFCDWTLGILRYQLTRDEEGLGLADMRKVIQYLGDKSGQAKVLAMQDWLLQQRQKVLNKANSTVSCFSKPCWCSGQACPGRARIPLIFDWQEPA